MFQDRQRGRTMSSTTNPRFNSRSAGQSKTPSVTGRRRYALISNSAGFAAPVHAIVYARHGRDFIGCKSRVRDWESSRRTAYQMSTPIDKVRGEGNCGRATDRGEEACECVRKCRPVFAVGHILVKAARLRTAMSYKAGSGRRVSTTSRSRSQTPVQVNDELAQRSITLLSGETCQAVCEPPFASTSKACLKGWNVAEQSTAGEAGVSRGRSTDPRNPIETGRTER
jgi:hypothetical protein